MIMYHLWYCKSLVKICVNNKIWHAGFVFGEDRKLSGSDTQHVYYGTTSG